MLSAHPDRLVKRPVATSRGNLPAAVGKLSDDPAFNLLFAVETAIGHLDGIDAPALDPVDAPAQEESVPLTEALQDEPVAATGFTDIIDAVSGIEEVEETLEEIAGESEQLKPGQL